MVESTERTTVEMPPSEATRSVSVTWESTKAVVRRLGPAGVLGLAATTLPVIGLLFLATKVKEVSPWLKEHPEGLGLFIAGFAILSGVAILPTQVTALAGGWTFGLEKGALATFAGFLGGALIGYLIARPTSGMRVVKLIDEHPKWRAVYNALLRGGFWRTLLIVTLLRLPPNSPFAITNVVLAATRVPLTPYLLGTLIGMTPRIGLLVWFGSHMATLDFAMTRNWVIIAGTAIATLIIFAVIGTIAKRAIERVTV